MNVELIEEAKEPDSFNNFVWLTIKNISLRPCVCTDEMKRAKKKDVMCKPCCARTIVNGIASLGEII